MKKGIQLLSIILLLSCFDSNISFSQEVQNIRTERKHGLSLKAGGDLTIFGLSYDAFISPKFNTEFNLSLLFPGVGAGIYYHPWGAVPDKNWSPYTGLHLAYNFVPFGGWKNLLHRPTAYLPLGLHLIGDDGLNFSIDAGCIIGNFAFLDRRIMPYGSISIGYRFYNKQAWPLQESERYKEKFQRKISLHTEKKVGLAALVSVVLIEAHIGLALDYFVLPQLDIEIFGVIGQYEMAGIGAYYHPWGGNMKWNGSPYIGFQAGLTSTVFRGPRVFDELGGVYYLPVGFHFISDSGFFYDLNIGGIAFRSFYKNDETKVSLALMLKFGYRL